MSDDLLGKLENKELAKQEKKDIWRPWDEFKKNLDPLPIKEPPCKHCANFYPIAQYGTEGVFQGVRVCHAEDMHHDFSCFRDNMRDVDA